MITTYLLVVFIVFFILQLLEVFTNNNIIFSIIETFLFLLLLGKMLFYMRKNNIAKDSSINTKEDCNNKILQIMKVYRHDWQNHLQIILGYVSVKKYEQIPKYISKVSHEAKQYSLISSFANKELSVFLYMLSIQYPKLSYELHFNSNMKQLMQGNLENKRILKVLEEYMNTFYLNIEHDLEHHLIISFAIADNNIIINFEYEGNINFIYDKLVSLGDKYNQEKVQALIDLYNDNEFIMELHISLEDRGV